MNVRTLSFMLTAVCLPLLSSTTLSQSLAVVQISGTVLDSSGSAVPDARISAVQILTGFTRVALSGGEGTYLLPQLPVGPYKLTVERNGFKTFVQTGITLQVGDQSQINVTLAVGEVSERVEVSANAVMLDTAATAVSTVIDQARIVELPLNGRQATDLIVLAGGAAPSRNAGAVGSKNYPSSVALAVAGGFGVNYLMDGADNEDVFTNVNQPFPFPDALQEFSVETSVTSASHGLHPGATVNVVTKSGTNQFHGDVFEFIRNGAFNARNYFAASRDTLHRNQYGGTVGGPVLRDRLFFFGGYQGTRNRQTPQGQTAFVPTPAMLNGDFSACNKGPHFDPTKYSAPAVTLATKYFPVPTDPCGKVTFGIPTTGDEDQFIGRADWTKSTKQTIFGRYFVTDYRNPAVFDGVHILNSARPGVLSRAQNAVLGHTYSLTPNIVNSAHFRFSRTRIDRGAAPNLINPTDIGVKLNALVKNFLDVSATNSFATGCGTCAPGHFNTNSYQGADDLDYVRGKHHFGFGGEYFKNTLDWLANTVSNGQFVFNGSLTGNPLSDFLLGRVSSVGKGAPLAIRPYQNIVSMYAQDSWDARPNLTVTLGLRWEPLLPEADANGIGVRYDHAAFSAGTKSQVYTNAPPGFFYYGDKGIPKSFTARDWNNFAPRIGVSYHPGDGTVIRASYGVFFAQPVLMYNERFSQVSPFGNLITLNDPVGGFADPYQQIGGDPFPIPSPPPQNAFFVNFGSFINMPSKMATPYVQQWNFAFEHQATPNLLLKATYMGNKGTSMWNQTEANPAVYTGSPATSTVATTNTRRMLYRENSSATAGGLVGSIAQADPTGTSNYNALIVSATKRFSNNFSVLSNYTWSKCLNIADNGNDLAFPQYQNPTNSSAEYGPCSYDHRHIATTSIVAMSPNRYGNAFARKILSDWDVSTIFRAQSGDLLNVVSGADNSRTGVGNDRPNFVRSARLEKRTIAMFFDTAAFTQNPIGTFGNLGRNTVLGPAFIGFDLGLGRKIKFTESRDFQIRAEAFNVLNHTNLSDPGTNMSAASTFGRITAAADPRIIQLSAKIHF
jgi:outer membrane receptor protein involved in Fe transport